MRRRTTFFISISVLAFALFSFASTTHAQEAQTFNYKGLGAMFIPVDGNTLIEAGQKPFGPDDPFSIDASSATFTVDQTAGTIKGKIAFTYTGNFSSSEDSSVRCLETITETTVIDGTFFSDAFSIQNNTYDSFAEGESQYSYDVVLNSLVVPEGYNDAFGTPDTTWCTKSFTQQQAFYALRNDGYAVADETTSVNKSYEFISIYTDVPYQIIARAWLDVPVPDLSIQQVQPIQVIQDALQAVPLVADKSTVVRVYPKIGNGPLEPINGVTGEIRAYRNGIELPSSPLNPFNGSITALNVPQEADANTTLNFLLPASWVEPGDTQLTVTINGPAGFSETLSNNSTQLTLSFYTRNSLFISYLPICWQQPGQQPVCPTAAINTAADILRKIFPVGDSDVQYTKLPVPSWIYKSSTLNGADWDALVAKLNKRYSLIESVDGLVEDQLAGWLPGVPGGSLLGLSDPLWSDSGLGHITLQVDSSTMNLASCSPAGQSFQDPIDLQMTLAHEIGHNLGLRHTNTADSCGAVDPSTPWPYATGTIQNFGFDVANQAVVPNTKFDVITYDSPPASNIWISPFTYNQLFNGNLNPKKEISGKVGPKGVAARYLVISGTVQADGSSGTLDPGYLVDSAVPSDIPSPTGNYCIRFTTAGTPLPEYCFNLLFKDHKSGAPLPQESFSIKAPVPPGSDGASLVTAQTGTVLASVGGTVATPVLSVDGVTPGQTLSGTSTITWTASGGDGSALSYVVMYTPDQGQHWYPLDVDTTDPQLAIDTNSLANGNQEYIRVLASDGYNTTQADVGPFTVDHPQQIYTGAEQVQQNTSSGSTTSSTGGGKSGTGSRGWMIWGLVGVVVVLGLGGVMWMMVRRKSK